MPELLFAVDSIDVERRGVAPQLSARLCIMNADPTTEVRTLSLDAQVRIRTDGQKDLFWTQTACHVPPFAGACRVKLPLPCSFDFNIAATRHLHRLPGGEVPVRFLFSGTVLYTATDGSLQVEQVPWTKEARYALPVRTWQDMMNHYYPDSVWLRIPRDVFERLHRYKRAKGLSRWEQAVSVLLDERRPEVTP